jgi:hypothetical protein
MHICSYPNDIQVTGPEVDWTRIVAEAIQVLRENPHTFDIMGAYNYTAINATQDGAMNGDMADMERQIQEEESDTKADGDVPGLKEVPKDGDLPALLPRNQIDSSDGESVDNGVRDDESADSRVPKLVPQSGSPGGGLMRTNPHGMDPRRILLPQIPKQSLQRQDPYNHGLIKGSDKMCNFIHDSTESQVIGTPMPRIRVTQKRRPRDAKPMSQSVFAASLAK